MDGWQAIATFALAAVPGVLVLEILQFEKPRVRDRGGLRGVARYLILSAAVWAVAVVVFAVNENLAPVINSADRGGQAQVTAYIALAWRLAATAVGVGITLRVAFEAVERSALWIEGKRQRGVDSAWGWLGTKLIELVSMSYAWDGLMVRLRRQAKAQVVHVRLQDGSDVFGILASGGSADFQGQGRGLVLDIELVERDGRLDEVPGSNGIFIVPEAVASIAFIEYQRADPDGTVES
jgi:hypothetical protein